MKGPRKRRNRKAPPPLAPTRSGRKPSKPGDVKVTKADGTVEWRSASSFQPDRKRPKPKRPPGLSREQRRQRAELDRAITERLDRD